MDLVQVWTVLAGLASRGGPGGEADVGRLARRALSDPLRLSVDEVAALASAVGVRWKRRPPQAGTGAARPPTAAQA